METFTTLHHFAVILSGAPGVQAEATVSQNTSTKHEGRIEDLMYTGEILGMSLSVIIIMYLLISISK